MLNNTAYFKGINQLRTKGGLVSTDSEVTITNNEFKNMQCKLCTGLAINILRSKTKIIGNKFIGNKGYQASSIYIEGDFLDTTSLQS